ncbi:MAG: hypothetical protein ACKVRO_01920 [Micropepsaceae bacterium]
MKLFLRIVFGFLVFVGVLVFFALLVLTDATKHPKGQLLARYDKLLPAELRGGYVIDFEVRDRSYSLCRSHSYEVSRAQMTAFLTRMKAEMASRSLAAYRWRYGPLIDEEWTRSADNRCGDERFKNRIEELLGKSDTLVYFEPGRTGFSNWDFSSQTFFEYLIVIDYRLNRVHTAFWNRDQGG